MPQLILLDLGLPPDTDGASEGLAILRETLQLNPMAKVIVVTGNSDRAKAIAAIESGGYDFIEKPVQLDVLKIVLQRAGLPLQPGTKKIAHCSSRAGQNRLRRLDRDSPQMQEVFRMIRRVGPSDVPVLITGESGTGKELVARAIHRQSRRSGGAFVAINCGAIPETLLESELFGYEKGAFTGAVQQRKGRIESAQGRHAVPGRNRRYPARVASQAAAILAGSRDTATGWKGDDRRRCQDPCGDQHRSSKGHQRRPVPRGSLLPAVRRHISRCLHFVSEVLTSLCWRGRSC